MTGYRRHVFVCLNTRDAKDPRGCCAQRGSEAVYSAFREGAAKAKLRDVRINRAGCLDHCAHGPSVVIYPEAVWYRVPTVDDAKRIVESHIINGRIVTDLLMETSESAESSSDAPAR
jgi:(2Fe-2S) ferredoxin